MSDYLKKAIQGIPRTRPTMLVVAAIGGALVMNWIWSGWISILIGVAIGILVAGLASEVSEK